MRIGIITQTYYPFPSGISEHVYYLAKNLIHLGHQPSIITSKFLNHNNDSHGLDVVRIGWNFSSPIPLSGTFSKVNIGYQTEKKLKIICEEKKFDLLHIHSPLEPVLPLVVLKTLSMPKIGTFHNIYPKYHLSYFVYEVFQSQFKDYAQLLDGRIAVSNTAKEFIEKYCPGEYFVIPNGVDLERFNPKVKPLERFNDGVFNILFVGRMDPRKGLKYLLKAFPLIYEEYPHCRLIIVGDGWLKEYYKMYLPNDLSDKVFFEGYVARDDLPHYYAGADVFCTPATGGESFGIVLLEAMASGKPIVASNIKGYSELITDGKDGILVAPKDPSLIKEAIMKLIKDKELRKKMGHQSLLKAKKFSWDKIVRQIVDCYNKVLARD